MALPATSTLEGDEKEVPEGIQVEAPSLKYIVSHYPPKSRQRALESLAVYGLRSLLAHFRLDQFLERGEGCLGLAFLTETTSAANDEVKTAVKDHYYVSKHKRGLNKVRGVKSNQQPLLETEDELAKEMEKETERLRGLYANHSRPDVLAKYPFVDSEKNEEGGGVAGALCSSGSIGATGDTTTGYFTTTDPLDFNFTGEKCPSFPTLNLAGATTKGHSIQGDAMPGLPQFTRLAKREIRHIADKVFKDFHSSAHGMRVADLSRALQTLIEGDNASPLSHPCGMHLILALAEEVLPSEIKFGLGSDSDKALSEHSAPSMANFAMEGDVGGTVARDDATISRRLWISVVWHIVKRLRELESSGILGDCVNHYAGSSTHHLPPSIVEKYPSSSSEGHYQQEERDGGLEQKVIKKKPVQSQHKLRVKVPKAGSTPLGMIGVSPPPHTLVMLAAKAQKAAQEMNEKRYENSSSNVPSATRLAMCSDRATHSSRKRAQKEAAMRAVAKERLECYAAGDLDSVQRGDSPGELAMDIANAFLSCDIASKCGISVHSDSITDDKDTVPLTRQEEHDPEISNHEGGDKEIGMDNNNEEGVAATDVMENSTQESYNIDDNESWEVDDEAIE